jgi:hypothetical protein
VKISDTGISGRIMERRDIGGLVFSRLSSYRAF